MKRKTYGDVNGHMHTHRGAESHVPIGANKANTLERIMPRAPRLNAPINAPVASGEIVRPFRNISELHSRNYSIRGVFSAIMAVSVAATLCGCATQGIVFATSENLCQDWRAISVSKNDKLTEQTASEIEANNKSRPAWGCNKNG